MPYVRPTTMRMSQTNGITSLLEESRYSSADTSVTAESSTQNDEHPSSPALMNGSGSWQNSISASFAQLAVQFQAASHNIAAIHVQPASESSDSGPALLAITERLDAIEEEQQRLADAINELRKQFEIANKKSNINELEPASPIVQASNGPTTADLEALFKAQQEAFKLEYVFQTANKQRCMLSLIYDRQEQLPAKLQNALATKSLSPLRMPPMKNKKQPTNAPATRGEFEHLTSKSNS